MLATESFETLVANLSGRVRRERIGDKQYLVADMTLIVPGVLNGSRGALFYPEEEILKSAKAWDGTILTNGHLPEGVNGHHSDTKVKYAMGFVRKPFVHNGRLRAEGWFDVEKTRSMNPTIINSLLRGDKIELSTGLDVDFNPVSGKHNGRFYSHVVSNYRPDHLAVLTHERGACSVYDGCGVNNTPKHKPRKPARCGCERKVANNRPAGGTLGIPTIDYGSSGSPFITRSVSTSTANGPRGGALGIPVMSFDPQPPAKQQQPATTPPQRKAGPAGGSLGIPVMKW